MNGRRCSEKFMSADVIPPKPPFDARAVASFLCTRGFVVIDGFLGSTSAAAAVRTGIAQLDDNGMMRLGKIQHGTNQDTANSSRSDRIAFLPPVDRPATTTTKVPKGAAHGSDTLAPEECSAALHAYIKVADGLRTQLSAQDNLVERVGGVLDGCNIMCAVYPGGGARYVKHRDALPYKAGRKLTVIYYLNDQWGARPRGELRIWPSDEADEEPVTIELVADRLLIFISSLEHEVLPAWCPRYALTTWMFNKRDTAMEALAEDIRVRKEAGRLDTKALLKMLEEMSSDDDDEDKAAK